MGLARQEERCIRMRTSLLRTGLLLAGVALGGCTTSAPTTPAVTGTSGVPQASTLTAAPTTALTTAAPVPSIAQPAARTMLLDTDVAGDDLAAIAFLVATPHVDLVGITVSGTGEAHCAGGVDVVLRLLDRLEAPDIPVACGRETPLAGSHTFPDAWRERVDVGSGLDLPATGRQRSTQTAVELIGELSKEHPELYVLTTGPLTNLADAMLADPGLAARLGPVFVMGGALHVPGNLVCCGAPEDNDVAEWNIYVDPHATQIVIDSAVVPFFVPLDGTNQVPITRDFADRAMDGAATPARRVLADLFAANPFMTDGTFYLWDALAAQLAAGYEVGSFSSASVIVEQAEGPQSGFTRPIDGEPNIEYLSTVDAAAAHDTLLRVLDGG
jgi:inosine-uridine nucleoside N-ribohydrolase